MFWYTKKAKFHFRCGTKPRNWNQATWNDCDVISRHVVSWKTDFSVIFLFSAKKWGQEMVQKCIVYKKIRKWLRNLFSAKLHVLKWHYNLIIPSLCFRYPTGREISSFWYIKTRGRKIAIECFVCCTLSLGKWMFYSVTFSYVKKRNLRSIVTMNHGKQLRIPETTNCHRIREVSVLPYLPNSQ